MVRPCNEAAFSQLPVIQPTADHPRRRKRGRGRLRACVLAGVHVIIAIHVAHYLWRGRTLSPIEPSEAMYALELGYINAGTVLLALGIIATAIFGRFFCGWGCHLVALQDLSGYFLAKLKVRPAPIRSRALGLIPYLLACYMFVWPSVERLCQGRRHPGFTNHLWTGDFWATFPGPVFAALTFVVCGGMMVYLLGNKGFCTYACPYGALFSIADRMAWGRIRVTDACHQCGQCTANCTSNVRVHEEVQRFGMVVDSGCMKCLDCVAVCPNNALYYGFQSAPPTSPGESVPPSPRRQFDLTLYEDALALLVAGVATFALRGLYGGPPLLLSVALGAATGYLAVFFLRLHRRRDVRLQHLTLRRQGRLTNRGWCIAALLISWFGFVVHSAYVQFHSYEGRRCLSQISVTWEELLFGAVRASQLSSKHQQVIHEAQWHLERAAAAGLMEMAEAQAGLAWIAMLHDDPEVAEVHLRRAVACRSRSDSLREMLFELDTVLSGAAN